MTSFKELAGTFGKLENISSSTSMIDTLARFLSKTSPDEARMTAYLLSGRIGPAFSAPEFGMAGNLVMRAIAVAFRIPIMRVQKIVVKSGDIGSTASLLSTQRGMSISITGVFGSLAEIARTSGAGAQKSKIDKLAALLLRVSPVEAKYVVRTVVGTHRIGVAEMTFLHGLAKAFGRGKNDKATLEHAYNVLSDLGEVAYRAAKSGVEVLARVQPQPGIPVRMMLATRVEHLDEVPAHLTGGMFVEYKYDGERVQIHKSARGGMHISSRRVENITHQYPEILEHVRKNLRARSAIVEGEVVAVDRKSGKLLPFQIMMRRKRKHEIERYRKEIPVAVFLFDMLYLNGRNLLGVPLAERKRLLARHIKNDVVTKIGTFVETEEMTEAEKYFYEATRQGAEGVVIKAASSPYQAGHRGWYWIKFKKEYEKELADTFDVVIVGALRGKGSRAGRFGSVLVAAFDPEANRYYSFTKIGAGLTDELLARLPKMLHSYEIPHKHRLVDANMKMDVWFEPTIVVEITGADLTVSPIHTVAKHALKKGLPRPRAARQAGGIALRFPRLLRIRDDKTEEQATSVREILAMYRARMRATRPTKRV